MQVNNVDAEYFEKANILQAIVQHEAGIALLRWLVNITSANRPIMSLEDAARRDVWLTIRRFVPVERLAEIEHHDLRLEQQSIRQMVEEVPPELAFLEEMINE